VKHRAARRRHAAHGTSSLGYPPCLKILNIQINFTIETHTTTPHAQRTHAKIFILLLCPCPTHAHTIKGSAIHTNIRTHLHTLARAYNRKELQLKNFLNYFVQKG